ncbi:hypothetical protein TNCV_2563411 [Trichonephila clavipes]|nr:hypothetical protein TNCV_2563411 [Trichonephila clavipes]
MRYRLGAGTSVSYSGSTSFRKTRYLSDCSRCGKMYGPSKLSPTILAPHINSEAWLCSKWSGAVRLIKALNVRVFHIEHNFTWKGYFITKQNGAGKVHDCRTLVNKPLCKSTTSWLIIWL